MTQEYIERFPEPGPEEVVIRVKSAGICASDLKCYLGAPLFWGDANREGYCQPPVIPGHKFVGEVVALGNGAGEKYRRDLVISRCPNKSYPAGIVASASRASTGCVKCTTFTAFDSW